MELDNVSLACKIFGCSRPTYYRYKKAYLEGGEKALSDVSRKKPNLKNQVLSHIAEAVLSLSLAHPEFGKQRARTTKVSHGEPETHYPCYLVSQDTCYIGHLKGVGFVYLQTAIDTYSKVAFAKTLCQ